eukprot:TRINITY_DN5675_c0_g1_i1.p1 TRINITY_DN5675_c0_g1~~TRINITY_DN5675_c0_g1_i1.p1  ORF type:complete len:475 (+),score=71.34 TRINITY_DN5675_c0_g1_i1:146-1570(+)
MQKSALVLFALCGCFLLTFIADTSASAQQQRMWGAVPVTGSRSAAEVGESGDWEVRSRFAGSLPSAELNGVDNANNEWLVVVSSGDIVANVDALWLGPYIEGEDAFLIYPAVAQATNQWKNLVLSQASWALRIIGEVGDAILVAKPAEAPYPAVWPAAPYLTARPVSDIEVLPPVVWEDTTAAQIDTAYNELIAGLVAQVDANRLSNTVQHLSDAFFSRLAYTTSSSTIAAQKWLIGEFIKLGYEVTAEPFRSGYTDNIIAVKPGVGDPTNVVLLGAHYDSRGPSMVPATRAPGADDNGSGTSAVLEIARVLASASFEHTIRFCLWSGEEQGLYGSIAYAKALRAAVNSKQVSVVAYLNADMISYKVPAEPVQLGMDTQSVTKGLVATLKQLATNYVPSLLVGDASGCCTDNMGFYDQGFATASFFERRGGIRNPYYHTSQDAYPASSNSFEQVQAITRVFLAGVATLAVPQDL